MADISSLKVPSGTTYTLKDSTARSHISNKRNPHGVTKEQVGLGNVANYDQSKAIKSITRSGTTFTATALDGTTFEFTQQDNNTTYGVATQYTNGLMSSSDKTKLDNLSISAITDYDIDKIVAS
mgnify:FL=1|nr:MAG TPA: Minor structural protein [Caudoviricetes sp.]